MKKGPKHCVRAFCTPKKTSAYGGDGDGDDDALQHLQEQLLPQIQQTQ
jgi:hypothetical protein